MEVVLGRPNRYDKWENFNAAPMHLLLHILFQKLKFSCTRDCWTHVILESVPTFMEPLIGIFTVYYILYFQLK